MSGNILLTRLMSVSACTLLNSWTAALQATLPRADPRAKSGWQAPDKERSSGGNWQREEWAGASRVTVTGLGASGISKGSEMDPGGWRGYNWQ